MNWQDKIYSTLTESNPYDLTSRGPKPKVRQGSVRSTLTGRSRAIWDKAQAKKRKSVSEAEGDIKRGGGTPGTSLSKKELAAMIKRLKADSDKKRTSPKQRSFAF